MPKQDQMWQPSLSQKNEVATINIVQAQATINIVQAQVEGIYFIVNLQYMYTTLSRGIPHGLPTKSQCSI
jgi:hypothetical protein